MKTVLFFTTSMLLATFVFCQKPNYIFRNYVVDITTTTTENPPSVSFKWDTIPGKFDISIYRKSPDSANWGNAIAILPVNTVEFTDNDIEAGINYEYKIDPMWGFPKILTYVNAGLKCREVEYRGKLILLVDSTVTSDLKYELNRYESDLVGDGWEVLRKDISRNVSVKYVKSIIRDFYNTDPENVNTVFLFGHIPVPYSGNKAFDGHSDEHTGAWPADMFYGDMNDELWTDKYVFSTSSVIPENFNVPGDGKFDLTFISAKEKISLAVGRVDFYDLPAFPQSETELLRNYLNKNHAFRHKINDPKMQALVDNNFPIIKYSIYNEVLSVSGWRNFTALLNSANVKAGVFFSDTKNESYIWSYASGGGKTDSCKYIGSTSCFVNQSPRTVFTGIYGSWFGDWNTKNNFMRAALASNGWILTCCWAGRPHYTFHQMGMGETIGYCVRATQNNNNTYELGRMKGGIHQSLLGDPALRMHIVRPVNSVNAKTTSNNSVMIKWNQTDDSIIGYYIYKLDTLTNKYNRINPTAVTETYFEDLVPDEGDNYYMIRTLKLSKVASGSYYNLSQGVFDTIYFAPSFRQAISQTDNTNSGEEPKIYPNPSTGRFNIDFGSTKVRQVNLNIYDLQGRLVCTEKFENCTNGFFELGNKPGGIYIVKGNIDEKIMTTKICLQ